MARRILIILALTVATALALWLLMGGGQVGQLNASINVPELNLKVEDRLGNPNLTILLLGDDSGFVPGARGNLSILGRTFNLEEGNGAYRARMKNISAGTYDVKVLMSKEGYYIPEGRFRVRVKFERLIEGDEIRLDLPSLQFETNRPEVCKRDVENNELRVDVLYDGSRIPLVNFEISLQESLDLSTFHFARINITFENTSSLSIGLIDEDGRSSWHTMKIPEESLLRWEFDGHEEELVRTSWDGLWGGLVPRHLEADLMDYRRIAKVSFRTTQRRDGADHSVTFHEVSFIRDPIAVSVCPPTLAEAINTTLAARSGPLFVDDATGLPYEFINLRERTVPASSDLDFTIGNNEIGEGHTSFWMYYFGSGEAWVGEFLHNVTRSMARYLDPGSGLIGLHHYDRRTGELESDTHRIGGCDFRGGPAGESSAQHGGEDPMYMMLPAAWHFKDEEAIAALERFSRTMLDLNSDPELIHLHLYVKICDGEASVGDWDGQHGDEIVIVEPSPEAYTDLSEFWWVTPMLGTAIVTQDEGLRDEIVARCQLVIDNVIEHQEESGRIPYVFRIDGSSARFESTALGWSGYNLNSFFVRSSYLMHNLTGDPKYIDALERMYDYFLDGHFPSMYAFASHIIFHAYYTGDESRVGELVANIRANYPLEAIENNVYGCTWALYPWVWNGSISALQTALEGESRFRSRNWVPIPYDSDIHHYYPLRSADTIIEWGWCPLDKFGSGVEEFYALWRLGSRSKGLVGRDLLVLGMFADIR
jgi:hypothetical protein